MTRTPTGEDIDSIQDEEEHEGQENVKKEERTTNDKLQFRCLDESLFLILIMVDRHYTTHMSTILLIQSASSSEVGYIEVDEKSYLPTKQTIS